MRIFILSSRDALSNIVFILSFNVTFGPPSVVLCYHNKRSTAFFNVRGDDPDLHVSREVIRSRYVSSSQPDMTRVIVKVGQPMREERTYWCQVVVEGRVGIVSGTYTYDEKGTLGATNELAITGE